MSYKQSGQKSAGYVTHPGSYFRLLREVAVNLSSLLRETSIDAVSINILKGGYSSNVTLSVKDSRKEYFVKIASEDSLASEVYWHRLAEKYKIETPALVAFDLSKDKFPFEYEITDYVKGTALRPVKSRLYAGGCFVGRELVKMHKIKVGGFGSVNREFKWRYRNWLSVLETERRQVDEKMAKKLFSAVEITAIDEITIYNKRLEIKIPYLLHGDLWEGNVLYLNRYKDFVILDPYIIGGDPMYDLAYSTVPRTSAFEKGVYDSGILGDLTENEKYRLKALRTFCLFREAVDYASRNDAKYKIDRLIKTLRFEMKSIL